jgi:hypothetical protein
MADSSRGQILEDVIVDLDAVLLLSGSLPDLRQT